ncbi:alpha/beta hydrolase-fold protein [Paenibacillus terrigena]|uniref:alpha/beta hydrolase n=1 Tax=Paenibacillus terrigena TaxID=369333 RepID=UPI0028D1B454|nr:alpha/beta hydrolase-fold protein [Paenibacillus terrigena]
MNGQISIHRLEQRELLIYLPPSYDLMATRIYPVVYMHDRGDLFDPAIHNTLPEIEALFAEGTLPEMIFVGIASHARMDAYTPWTAPRLSDQRTVSDFGGQGDKYLSFIVEQCKPYIDKTFRADARAEATGLLGKSLGGLISMYGEGKQTVQREMVTRTQQVYAHLQAVGRGSEQLTLIMDEGASHEAGAFARRFPSALTWLYRE